jgi:tryptophan synthase beta chain
MLLKHFLYCWCVQVAAADPNARYALGSVLNHVLMHQTIIGEEALLQLAKIGETPDLVVSHG